MTHRWRAPRIDTESAQEVPPNETLVERVLRARGFDRPDARAEFCDPRLTALHNPSDIPDLDKAAHRILDAINAGERIVIYGDYDVDGVTAAAILHHITEAIRPGAALPIYIPHRIEEGYGVNTQALKRLAADGARVIITVDCGITALEPAREAKRLGVDLIITDHHNPPATDGDLPDAFAVVHPRRPGSSYPFGELCGAGVAFKLAWRIATLHAGSDRVPTTMRETLLDLLALAALGTIADIVPLIDENRVIARFGLARLRDTKLVGLTALIHASKLDDDSISSEDVGFRLGPRLNACGRLGHAREAAELLVTTSEQRAEEIAEQLSSLNTKRRAMETAIFAEADELARESDMTSDTRRAIVLSTDHWHPGVLGIVCSRLVRRYGRPTILMRHEDGVCKGSGRSIDGFNLHAALGTCSELLKTFGGHDMAAGLTLQHDRLPEFVEVFLAHAKAELEPDDLVPALHVDCDAQLSELTPEAVAQLETLAPFGRSNPRPRIRLTNLRLARPPETFGAFGKHLSIFANDDRQTLRFIAWGWGERRTEIHSGDQINAVIEPKLNHWRGKSTVEPELLDLMRC